MLKSVWEKIRFKQKTERDAIAYSYLTKREKDKLILDVGSGIGRFISQNPKK